MLSISVTVKYLMTRVEWVELGFHHNHTLLSLNGGPANNMHL